jgi:glycosyltransferase involved in cell wall biosynthesis
LSSNTPLLSICIPTYNRASLLAKTLTHLRSAFGDEAEIVVSDNCSTDRTQDVIAAHAPHFRRFRTVRQTENRGSMPNFAAAISLATGEFLYTLSDDDEIYIDGIMAAIHIMQGDPNIVAVYGAYQEWSRETGEITPPIRFVEKRMDAAQRDQLELLNRFSLLWFPVCRRQVIQRFFTYDERSFGFWELVGVLLKHGGVSIIPDVFYKHAHTHPRMEYELTKGWYHDAHRAQFETFMGRLGPADFQVVSTFVNSRVVPAYMQGVRFAEMKGEFLTARHFMLRTRAYGQLPEEEVARWELAAMVSMVAERLRRHIELVTGMHEVVFETTPMLAKLKMQFQSIAPTYTVGTITPQEWAMNGLRAHCYLVTYEYGGPGFETTTSLGPARCRAVADIIETCRITDQPLTLS